jgi:nitroreductase
MEFFETVEKRQSVRAFAATPVPEEKLQAILEAVNRAPSAGNFQSFETFLIDSLEKREALTRATYSQNFVVQAPVSLVFCANPSRCTYEPPSLYALEDASIACAYATLAVTAVGLSSVWIGAFKAPAVLEVLGSPKGLVPVAILPIGYANETPDRTTRRPLEELVHRV